MRLFGYEIKKVKKEPYRPYNDNCMYCPSCKKQTTDYWESKKRDVQIGWCTDLGQLVNEFTIPPCYSRNK